MNEHVVVCSYASVPVGCTDGEQNCVEACQSNRCMSAKYLINMSSQVSDRLSCSEPETRSELEASTASQAAGNESGRRQRYTF